MKRFFLFFLMSSLFLTVPLIQSAADGIDESLALPLSKPQKIAKKYKKKIKQAQKLGKKIKGAVPLDSQLPLSSYKELVNEYNQIYQLLTQYDDVAAMFSLVHTKPLLKKQGIRRQYIRAVKAFEQEHFFGILPQELQTRIKNFDQRVVRSRPRMARKHKVAIILSSLAAAGALGAGAYALAMRKKGGEVLLPDPNGRLALRDRRLLLYPVHKLGQVMKDVEPHNPNWFKQKAGHTWQSFDQAKMGKHWNDMPNIVISLLHEVKMAGEKMARALAASQPIDQADKELVKNQLLSVGRICLYLEQVDRTRLKQEILLDREIFNSLMEAIRSCPVEVRSIFETLAEEQNLGLNKSKFWSWIRQAFDWLISSKKDVYQSVQWLLTKNILGFGFVLPDGVAADIASNDPSVVAKTWVNPAQKYTIPPPHE